MNKIMVLSLVVILLITGCEVLKEQAKDPNSTLNKGVATTQNIGAGLQEGGKAGEKLGIPFSWILTETGTVLVALSSIYLAWRKKVLLDETNDHLENVTATTQSIVQAIDAVGGTVIKPATSTESVLTVGNVIKTEVGKNLALKNIYETGKAIITGLKM